MSSEKINALLEALPHGQFIAGEWTTDEESLAVENPTTGEPLAHVADAKPEQAIEGLDAACAAQEEWARSEPRERAELLRRAFDLVIERRELFATCMSAEMGKPLSESDGEVTYGAEFLRWASEQAAHVHGQYGRAPSGGMRLATIPRPVGPVYAVTPWNFPLAMATRKIGPALAAGCTVVVKPASQTPLTTLLFVQALIDAGLPSGVVNCLTTSNSRGFSDAMLADPRLRKLTFTGSTGVGADLLAKAAGGVLRTSMELGGDAPLIVLPDADLDKAVAGALAAKMRNIGEACTSANRMLVHASVAEEFARELASRMGALTIGDPLADGTQVGPLISADARDEILDKVEEAVSGGGFLLCGGRAVDGPGHFMEPTVVLDPPRGCRLVQQETFGPVAPVIPYANVDEAIAIANDTSLGLAGYVFGTDLGQTLRVAESLETGLVGVNTGVMSNPAAPFGGIKQSGLGREGGDQGIWEYLEIQYLGIAT